MGGVGRWCLPVELTMARHWPPVWGYLGWCGSRPGEFVEKVSRCPRAAAARSLRRHAVRDRTCTLVVLSSGALPWLKREVLGRATQRYMGLGVAELTARRGATWRAEEA